MAETGTLDKFTIAPGRYVGQDEFDDIQDAVEASLKAIHLRLTGYGVLERPSFAASSTPDLDIHLGAGSVITPTGDMCRWTATDNAVDVTSSTAGSVIGPSAVTTVNKQRYIVVGATQESTDSEPGFIYNPGESDDGDPYNYRHTAEVDFVVYMSAEVALGEDWELSSTFATLLAEMRADDVEPLVMVLRTTGDTVITDAQIFECGRWIFEAADHRAEHLDLRQQGAHGHFPVVANATGKIAYSTAGAVVTIPGGETVWIGWLSDRNGLQQRSVTVPASSVSCALASTKYMIRMYLDAVTGEPTVYLIRRTNDYPDDTAIGLESHGLSGGVNGAFPATLVDVPLVQCDTDAGCVVVNDAAIANTAVSWLEYNSTMAGLTQHSDGVGFPVTLLHRPALPFHPTRDTGAANVSWDGGRAWMTEGLSSWGAGGGAILNNWYCVKAKVDGSVAPQNHNLDLSGLPDDDELPLAGFLGNAGVFCYRDMGFWGAPPHIEGFDLHLSDATPGILTIHPGHYFKQGRVVPGPQKYTISMNDAGLANYRDTNFALVNSTWYYLYMVPLAYYRTYGQGAAPTDGGLTAYPFLSLSAPDYSGGHPTWPWAQFVAALRCTTAATGAWVAITKRGDFVARVKATFNGIIPPNAAVNPPLLVDLSTAVPLTATEVSFSIYFACSGNYIWAIGPVPGATFTNEYPYDWTFVGASAEYLGPIKVPLYAGAIAAGVHTIGTATIANLTSMAWYVHGYYEPPIRPYHYEP